MEWLIVVDQASDWPDDVAGTRVIRALDYLTQPDAFGARCRVINLCRSYAYQSTGYYVSLQAAARGHRPLPGVMTVQDLRAPSVLRLIAADLDDLMRRSLAALNSDEFVLSVYFGRNMAKRHERLARALFNLFPAPLMRARFARKGEEWQLVSLRLLPLAGVPEPHKEFLHRAAVEHFQARTRPRTRKSYRYDLAILVNPEERLPPSDKRALRKFERAGRRAGFSVEFISPQDYGRLAEFDALLIRETTLVNHHTYRFARRAQVLGLVVIDDPDSILRCTNKVFLAELLERHRIPTPKTCIVHRSRSQDLESELGFPCVLKQPDGSFSQAVIKVNDGKQLRDGLKRFFAESDLVLAQAFEPTEYDWRVGVLDGRPLYACRYFMARGHWQIIGRNSRGGITEGKVETLAVEDAPPAVIDIAVRAARAVGQGLYGVDIKTFGDRAKVIEVNDNPSIDAGSEDLILGDALYDTIINEILRRVEVAKK
jgi:glutathione synthase/RimK-type ligase-like ATP-grasp enzyme